jgi:hypothetical protein
MMTPDLNPIMKQAMVVTMLSCMVVDTDRTEPEFDISLKQLRQAVDTWRDLVEKAREEDGT